MSDAPRPAGTPSNRYLPAASVLAVTSRELATSSIETPGSGAPVWSSTRPPTRPNGCASA